MSVYFGAPGGPAVPRCGAPLCSITFITGEEVEEIFSFACLWQSMGDALSSSREELYRTG